MNTYMNTLRARLLPALALLLVLTASSGCFVVAAGAAGAGAVAFELGELKATLGKPYDAVVSAADKAIEQLQFSKISEKRDAITTEIIARTAEDKKVHIKITREADAVTKVKIRIGTFGKEEESRAILDRINASL